MTREDIIGSVAPAAFRAAMDSPDTLVVVWDRAGAVRLVGAGAAAAVGRPVEVLEGLALPDVLGPVSAGRLQDLELGPGQVRTITLELAAADGRAARYACRVTGLEDGGRLVAGSLVQGAVRDLDVEVMRINNELVVVGRENRRITRELEASLAELDSSYWHMRKVQEVLPICLNCQRVDRSGADGEPEWGDLVEFLKDNALFLSHGLCPTCVAAAVDLEPGLDLDRAAERLLGRDEGASSG